jgi:arylsulfatase
LSVHEPPFQSIIGRTYRESSGWWPTPVEAPAGAPNVVYIVLDDVGFAHLGCYGSNIDTPHMDRLAAGGLRYTNFHTTAMCSPTRACLLSGRNHHAAGLGVVTEYATGFPGYAGRLTKRACTLAEVLKDNGYNCFAVGKWHLMPLAHATPAGPFDYYPLQRGFERWYGFPSGYTDQWAPELFDGNVAVDPPTHDGYHLSEDLVDRAIDYVRDQTAIRPDRPFFLYVAFGAAHWPHQAPRDSIEKYRGRFDMGWDVAREQWLAKQQAMGIVPRDVTLPPGDPDVPAWESLSADEKRLAARHMEVYAGFLDHTDAQIGRLVDYLEQVGRLDNTMIVLISDNGCSDEGGRLGCVNVNKAYVARIPEPVEEGLRMIDQLGNEHTSPHYPRGWAQAGNTPLKWYKKDTHGGGVRDPLIVHWPARVKDGGSLRHQYHHVVDITPTVLDLIGVEPPSEYQGIPQLPMHGTSFAYSLGDAAAPTRKRVQYYEMIGDRALWHDGWKAVALHKQGTDFDADRWELYHLDQDYNELHDLAAEQPEKLRELIDRWWVEAGKNDVLPLDDRDSARARRDLHPPRSRYEFVPGTVRVDRRSAPDVSNRSHAITASVDVPADGAEGVLLACGGRPGGFALFVHDGRLVYEYNFGGADRTRIVSERPVPHGPASLRFEFTKTGRHRGRGQLTIDGQRVGEAEIPHTWPNMPAIYSLTCGREAGSPVSELYRPPFAFTGTLRSVVVELGDDQERDVPSETRAILASD